MPEPKPIPAVINVGRIRFPVLAVSMRVARNLPATVRGLAEELREARELESDGGAKVTFEEVQSITAHVFERLAEGVLPLLLRANGLPVV